MKPAAAVLGLLLPGCLGLGGGSSPAVFEYHHVEPVPGDRGPRLSGAVGRATCAAACGESVLSCAWADAPLPPQERDVYCEGDMADGSGATRYLARIPVARAHEAAIDAQGHVPRAACPSLCAHPNIQLVHRCEAKPEPSLPPADQRWVTCVTPDSYTGVPGV